MWRTLVAEHAERLADLPKEALRNERAFRDYLTSGVHRDIHFQPPVSELTNGTIGAIGDFLDYACFDMDVGFFDAYNEAARAMFSKLRRRIDYVSRELAQGASASYVARLLHAEGVDFDSLYIILRDALAPSLPEPDFIRRILEQDGLSEEQQQFDEWASQVVEP